ncbi:MAG TPA: carbohydrate binding domain-containing protein [Chitinispirillaceae bacterium]|nr:carbohydrate binding domain-containing protein [Chitinispirillaceae bacterium]
MWIYTWKYLTETKKCDNLLWVFSSNYWSGNAEKSNPRYYYPGHRYVDVLGCDVYTNYGHSFAKSCHDSLRAIGEGKPIAITENGTMPVNFDSWRSEQPFWVYWLTWWGFQGDDKGNTKAVYDEVYAHPSVITLDKINSVDTSVKIVSVSVEGCGTVAKIPNSATVKKGTSVQFTATPADGWKFEGWSGTEESADNPLQLSVNENCIIKAVFKPLPGTKLNIIKNGDFSDATVIGWNPVLVTEGGAATDAVVNGEMVVTITNGGALAWSVQLTQNDLQLEKGKKYILSFDAYAAAKKDIFVKIGQNGGEYLSYSDTTFNISTTSQTFIHIFTMSEQTDPAARIEFNIGLNTTEFHLDNVWLVEDNGTSIQQNSRFVFIDKSIQIRSLSNNITVSFPKGITGKDQISVFRIDGSKVLTIRNNRATVNFKDLVPGTYMIHATDGLRNWSKSFCTY